MDIFFRSKSLQKVCSQEKEIRKKLGTACAKKLKQRMMELNAAEVLADISYLPPPRLHELTGREKGQFSVDLQHPYRLLFIVADDPEPTKPDGGLDLACVKQVEIIKIADTH
jgi:proteic killer suppression protein